MTPIRHVRLIETLPNGALFDCGGGLTCRVAVLGERLARVLFLRDGTPREPASWMVLRPGEQDVPWAGRDRLDESGFAVPAVAVSEEGGVVRMAGGGLAVTISTNPFRIVWAQEDGRVFAADRPSHPYLVARRGRGQRHHLARHPDDRYFGLGDKTGPLDLKGRRLRTVMTDALGYDPKKGDPLYKHWPFVIARDGATGACYGLLYDTMAPATFDLGAEHDNYHGRYRSFESTDGDLDYWMILGPKPHDVTRGFLQLTGSMALPPRWSLGYAQTAMSLADAPDAQAQIEQFRDRAIAENIPCSAFHFGSGYTSIGRKRYVFTWNRAKFPDPEGMIRRFHEAGWHVVANIKPCLLDDHPDYGTARQAGAFVVEAPSGAPALEQFWDGEGAHIDFTTAEGVRWWQDGLRRGLFSVGMDVAWNDNNEYPIWNEDAVVGNFGRPMPIDLGRPVQALLMTRASVEAQAEDRPAERPFSITRAGCPGIQRYAQTWSGDNTTSWDCLRYNLRTGLTMGLSGMANIGHDVGGFAGPIPDAELLVRWMQAGAIHPRFIANSWKEDGTTTTPWLHPEVIPLVRAAIRLRYRLIPHLYTLIRAAAEQDDPILAPTFVHFPDDPACWAENDELMVGPSLLAAPVFEPGARARSLYLPAGPAAWYDFYDEQILPAGETVTVGAALGRLPLFAAAGSVVAMTDQAEDFSRLHDEPSRCLRVFPHPGAGRSESRLAEDDGLAADWRNAPVSRLRIVVESDAGAVRIAVTLEGDRPLACDRIAVCLPEAETRRVHLEAGPGVPALVRAPFRWHALM